MKMLIATNTDNSHHRYDVLLLINGVPCAQIELKTLGVNPRRAMEQIVEMSHEYWRTRGQFSPNVTLRLSSGGYIGGGAAGRGA
mgnify:CR=1 FL=1